MSDIGYRKKGDSRPMYNPERDYAYITPTLMRMAIERMDLNSDADPAAAAWLAHNGVSQTSIVLVAEALADAQRDFVNASDPVNSFEQALRRHDFYSLPYATRLWLFANIGTVFCAAWFKAVREVSNVFEASPAQEDMARFSAAVRQFAAGDPDKAKVTADCRADVLQMENDVLQARLDSATGLTEQLIRELRQCREAKNAVISEVCQPAAVPTASESALTRLKLWFTGTRKAAR